MDFDEYEYLEKTVVTPTAAKENGDIAKPESKEDSAKSSKRRTEEDGHRSEHRSKRSKGDEDQDKDRDRSRHHRDREHRSNRYDKERESRRDTDRERKSRDEERGDKGEHRRRDKGDHKDRKEREGSRDSSHRERDREKEVRDRRSRERREKKDDAPAEPEADPERDQRTVFAWQICLKATEKDVYEFFSKAGKVRDVRLIMDRNSRRSKGVGYIEFYDSMSVPLALAMSGQILLGQAVMVKPSEAEKNLVHAASSAAAAGGGFSGSYAGGARRLYVGNLHVNITEEQLRQVFDPFGIVELVQLPTDPETGLCKGYGFVQYQKLEDARCAQIALNGVLELAGRPVKVSAVSDQQTGQEMGITQGDLDDDEGGGLALNARSRALLMQKLDRSGIATSSMLAPPVPAPLAAQSMGVLGSSMFGMPLGLTSPAVVEEPIGTPNDCLLLKNMFDPATEVDPDFDLDIKEDVQEECSKHGTVKHIYVDKRSAGHVYVRFSSTQAAASAQRALHKRWFAGKSIIATFMTSQAYEAKFPESKYSSRV